jgi:GNAT superfamily N-acetyltransferase
MSAIVHSAYRRPVSAYSVRSGQAGDLAELLRLLDGAVEWLGARGAAGQWGREPFSASEAMVAYLEEIVAAGELRVAADVDGAVVGGYVLGARPAYAQPIAEPERYLEAMVSDRHLAGRGVGSLLVMDAVARSSDLGAYVLRADCWAEGARLIRWYEAQGFTRDGVIRVGDWPAQLLRRELVGSSRAPATPPPHRP